MIILGHTAAQLLLPDGMTAGELIGKRLLTRTGYVTIVGILPPDGSSSDSRYYAPTRILQQLWLHRDQKEFHGYGPALLCHR